MAASAAWETLKHAIEAYTGLSPAAFFTLLAVGAAIYYAVAGFFAPPPQPQRPREMESMEPILPPVQLGEITEEELRAYDGSDRKKPLLMAIKGQIYDVSQSRMFYGPDGVYALFAGRDASRALAKMSFEPQDLTSDISGLGPFELDTLQDWEYKFMSKYSKVGTIKRTVLVSDESDENTPEETEKTAEATKSADIQADHNAQTKEATPLPSDHDAKADHSEEVKEDYPQGHGEGAKHDAELKEDAL